MAPRTPNVKTAPAAKPAAKAGANAGAKARRAPAKAGAAAPAPAAPTLAPLARTAKGKRPRYFQDPATDRLQAMVVALTAELSVTRDRLDTLERLIEAAGLLPRARLEAYVPDAGAEQERGARRQAMIARILRPLAHERDEMRAGAE